MQPKRLLLVIIYKQTLQSWNSVTKNMNILQFKNLCLMKFYFCLQILTASETVTEYYVIISVWIVKFFLW